MHIIPLMIIAGIILTISSLALVLIAPFMIGVRAHLSVDRRLILIVVQVAGVRLLHFSLKLVNNQIRLSVNGKEKELGNSSLTADDISKLYSIIKKNVIIHVQCSVLLAINEAMQSALICGILQSLPNSNAYFSAKGEGVEVDLRVYGKLNIINAVNVVIKSKKLKIY